MLQKKKHKLIAVYLSFGDLPDNMRSHINKIKFVAVCTEKFFDGKIVYDRIVSDLKKLEQEGIRVCGKLVKGAVVFIAGDNLGSHSLGGYIENFSTSRYFCRYCHVTIEYFFSKGGYYKSFKRRTPESYYESLSNIGGNKDSEGVKFNSLFNNLEHFHVCAPGLPSCLGHDLLEGVVAYDAKLLIDQLIQEKWFSLQQLNKRIDSFQYSSEDRKDKPATIPTKIDRLAGGAWQIFNFLRLLPLLIEDTIQDIHNEAWLCLLLLMEIVEIICAPEIHTSCVSYLNRIIFEYLSVRIKLFPSVRLHPKHHYLSHYASRIIEFGPLIKVWTMRFESKHPFSSELLNQKRYLQNFINLPKSLAEKHELYQSFLRLGADIRNDVEITETSAFNINIYDEKLQAAIRRVNLSENVEECNAVNINGTIYKKGCFLVFRQTSYQYNVTLGKICILLCDNKENVYALFEIIDSSFVPYLRVYELGDTISYECSRLQEVVDFKPMYEYKLKNILCLRQHHAFASQPV